MIFPRQALRHHTSLRIFAADLQDADISKLKAATVSIKHIKKIE
jgi:hypothetical protein